MSAPIPQPPQLSQLTPEQERKRRERRNGLIFLGTLGTVIVLFVLAGLVGKAMPASSSGPAPTVTPTICRMSDYKIAADVIRGDAKDFGDIVTLADSTPRVALAPQIQRMQAQRKTTQARGYSDCALPAANALLKMMDAYIDGYIAFLGQQDGYKDTIRQANDLAITAAAELAKLTP